MPVLICQILAVGIQSNLKSEIPTLNAVADHLFLGFVDWETTKSFNFRHILIWTGDFRLRISDLLEFRQLNHC